jgi:predicted O-methyltransferase YrrM
MLPKSKITFADVERKRRDFAQTLREFVKARGKYHNRAPELPQSKLEGCEILSNRLELLDRVPKGGIIAEIGAANGDFSAAILARCAPERLHLFGLDAGNLSNPDIRAELVADASRVKPHMGEAARAFTKFPVGHFDLIYINGDHELEAVHSDIAMALPALKPTGALMFHSYTTWSPVSMYHCGVARAVHEFCLENAWKFRYIALETMMYNDVMLVREDS